MQPNSSGADPLSRVSARRYARWRTAWFVALGVVAGTELGSAAAHAQTTGAQASPSTFQLEFDTLVVTHGLGPTPLVQIALDQLGIVGTASDWHLPRTAVVDLARPVTSLSRLEGLVSELSLASGFTFASPRFVDADGHGASVGKELIVAFEPWVGDVLARELMLRYGDVVASNLAGMPDVYRIQTEFRSGFDVLAAALVLDGLAETRWCQPDLYLEAEFLHVPNDPLFPEQWALANTGQAGGAGGYDLGAPAAWDITRGDATIIVGVLDDGVQQNHPDIAQIAGLDFTASGGNGGPVSACDRHATAVAGCIAGGMDNGLGTTGIAPNARVQSLKVVATGSVCNGQGVFQTSWFLAALDHCEQTGVRITNTSLGFAAVTPISEKFASTRVAGVVHFASAGNSGGSVGYPASLPDVLAVGAIAATGARASFSSYGPELDLVAPGQSIWTTDRTDSDGYVADDYAVVNGTSFAAPYAAGVAALVLSIDPSLTATEVEGLLATTAQDLGASGRDDEFGHGLVRADRAVAAAAGPSGPPQIASATPTTLAVLAIDHSGLIVVTGAGLAQTTGARIGGITLAAQDVLVVDDGRVELTYTRLPQLGSLDVELLYSGGVVAASVTAAPVAVPTLELADSGASGLDRAVGLEIVVASQPDDIYYLIGSLYGTPTDIPGIIAADIGGGDLVNIYLLAIGVVDPLEGANRHVIGIGGLPLGLVIHVQAGVLDGHVPTLPLATTNTQSGTIVQ